MNENAIAMAGMLTGIIISLGSTGGIIFAIYYWIKARNKERLALIEKGADVSEIYKPRNNKNAAFKWGVVIIGIAIGLLIGSALESYTSFEGGVAYSSMVLMFGGAGLLLANFIKFDKEL
ncbi:MAG: hypothetical protein KAI79_02240 [Bacteroidales bacterium]|nr:hypothetical protein [Bacteroidales bacterium]